MVENGDSNGDDDAGEVDAVIGKVRECVQGLERRLDQLQQQLLARGTRDVRQQALAALAQIEAALAVPKGGD